MDNSTNSSSNDPNSVYYLKVDDYLTQFAQIWTLNSIYLLLILPLGLIGFFLNLLCFYILRHDEFKSAHIYSYFRVTTINSAMLCIVQGSLFISLTHRYFRFSNTYEANAYSNYVYLPVANVFLLYGSVLDMIMSIERSSLFYLKLKDYLKPKPHIICLILFIITALISVPYFFINCPYHYDVPIDETKRFRLWYWDITDFGRSLPGQILSYANFIIRDVLLLIFEIALNIFNIVLFRNYFKKKANLLSIQHKISQTPLKSNDTNTNTTETPNDTAPQSSHMSKVNKPKKSNQLNNLSTQEKNLTIMIIIICFFSIVIHIFYLIVGILLNFSDSLLTSSTGAFVATTSILKHMSNIFFLFLFNVNFRKKFIKTFSIC